MGVGARNKAAVNSEADDLFQEAGVDPQTGDDSDGDNFDDLLDQVVEDDSEGWVPAEKGDSVAGKVVKVGVTKSDFANDGENPYVPTMTLQNAEGKFRVIGYGAVLRREMLDANPRIGDRSAVKFFGEKALKKGKFAGKTFNHFGVAVARRSEGTGQDDLVTAMTRATDEWKRSLRAASA